MTGQPLLQLAPTPSFTEPQRRELNALLLRIPQSDTGTVLFGRLLDRPAFGVSGRFFVALDQLPGNRLSVDTGSAWFQLV